MQFDVQNTILVVDIVRTQVGIKNHQPLIFIVRQIQHGFEKVGQDGHIFAENFPEYKVVLGGQGLFIHAGAYPLIKK
jgi:hypothetical protein